MDELETSDIVHVTRISVKLKRKYKTTSGVQTSSSPHLLNLLSFEIWDYINIFLFQFILWK